MGIFIFEVSIHDKPAYSGCIVELHTRIINLKYDLKYENYFFQNKILKLGEIRHTEGPVSLSFDAICVSRRF